MSTASNEKAGSATYQVSHAVGHLPGADVFAVLSSREDATEHLHHHAQPIALVAPWAHQRPRGGETAPGHVISQVNMMDILIHVGVPFPTFLVFTNLFSPIDILILAV